MSRAARRLARCRPGHLRRNLLMSLVCRACSRTNPADACYCYYDGVALTAAAEPAGAVATRPFLAPFVFPSGRSCRNFDELVLACEAEWPEASKLLVRGQIEAFLGGMGRLDLAAAAQQAVKQ